MIGQRPGQADVQSLDQERRNLAGYVETHYHRWFFQPDDDPLPVVTRLNGWKSWTFPPLLNTLFFETAVVMEKWVKGVAEVNFYWYPDSTNTGTVRWTAEFSVAAAGTVLGGTAVTTISPGLVAAPGVIGQLVISSCTSAFALTNDYDLLRFRVLRNGTVDTFTGNAELVGVRLIFRDAQGGVI